MTCTPQSAGNDNDRALYTYNIIKTSKK